MQYDIIFVTGELFFDHPLCGVAVLKRWLEKNNYSVGVIEMPKDANDITKLGEPKLFFGVTSGAIDSMIRNYTPLKKSRADDSYADYDGFVPDRAVIVYSNWIRTKFKSSKIVLGGTEATLRRFVHYDYWDNKLRKPILFDSRADILVYGFGEKQIIEICERLKHKKQDNDKDNNLKNIQGTCIIGKEVPEGFIELPSNEEVTKSKEKFCDMTNLLNNYTNLAQKIDNRYVLQYKSPIYTPKDLDEYYDQPFERNVPRNHLQGFQFSVVTHRGCFGDCNFCSIKLAQGNKVVSRSEESILKEIERITKHPEFRGNIDDLGGPSANMYGMDCNKCFGSCIDCKNMNKNDRAINLLRKASKIKGIKKINIRSGIRYDIASPEYMKEVAENHTFDTLRIAPEHVNHNVLKLMNKDKMDLNKFLEIYKKTGAKRKLSFYFITAHPGSTMDEAEELANALQHIENAESVQIFTPTPMTVSTCMYYTGMDPKTKKKVYVPYTYAEKKEQKRVIFRKMKKNYDERDDDYSVE